MEGYKYIQGKTLAQPLSDQLSYNPLIFALWTEIEGGRGGEN